MTWETLWSSTDADKDTDAWATPDNLFESLHKEFGFTLDSCATKQNAKVPNYIDKDTDALSVRWQTFGRFNQAVFCNPPYGRGMERWLAKAWETCRDGATVVVLIFARTDTQWWAKYAPKAAEWRFVSGRLKFYRPGTKDQGFSAPAPSVLLVFRPTRGHKAPQVRMIDREGGEL